MIPTDWTVVVEDLSGEGAVSLRVERLAFGGFLLHTRYPSGEADIWLETEAEVHESLTEYYVLDLLGVRTTILF